MMKERLDESYYGDVVDPEVPRDDFPKSPKNNRYQNGWKHGVSNRFVVSRRRSDKRALIFFNVNPNNPNRCIKGVWNDSTSQYDTTVLIITPQKLHEKLSHLIDMKMERARSAHHASLPPEDRYQDFDSIQKADGTTVTRDAFAVEEITALESLGLSLDVDNLEEYDSYA
jgi:hypothetical protein